VSNVPDRVRSLIEKSGLSRHAFALRIGLDDSKLSKSMSGARRFSSLDLARMAEECQVTVDWLLTGDEPVLAMAARTTSGEAGAAVALAKRYSALRKDITSLGYAQPWQPVTQSVSSGSYVEQGGRLAHYAITRMGDADRLIGNGNLWALVEEVFGVDVAVAELGAGFDGLAVSSDAVKLVVLATSHLPYRQRFTLAHELGHLLAGDDQELHLDRDIFGKEQAKDPSEARANAFASAFLMPEQVLRDAVGSTGLTEQVFAELACSLMVSPSALAYRLSRLRLIDAGSCERFKSISGAAAASTAGRTDEFSSQVAEAKSARLPGILVRDTYAAYESGAATLRPYANLLGVDVDALRQSLESEHGTHDDL
jgi:Zn-dependent peptidase ImmA (M78 family)/transcriptional regulator with XRE-family HTH domain